jgi:hypothetical protein
MAFFRRHNPEDPESLKQLIPSRLFSLSEVTTFVDMAQGMVNDGLLFRSASPIEEKELWYEVEITYDDGSAEGTFETWYFFKA